MELFDLRPDWDALSTDVTELPNSGTEHLEESNSDGNEIMSSLKALQDLRHMQVWETRPVRRISYKTVRDLVEIALEITRSIDV